MLAVDDLGGRTSAIGPVQLQGFPTTGRKSAFGAFVVRTRRTSIEFSSTFAEFDHRMPIAWPG